MHIEIYKIVAISIHEATWMTVKCHGLITRLRKNVSQLMDAHCISHWEDLATQYVIF